MDNKHTYDVIIVGGSYAGLSAAMALGRSLRQVLIIDAGQPCNRQTPHAHNLIAHDGDTPAAIAAKAREQALDYPTVQMIADKVVSAGGSNGAFKVITESGEEYTSKKVLLATGVHDIPLPIPGFAECWGISVLHCPYCHGYEVHGQPLGIIATGDMTFEFARLINNWTSDLTLFTNGLSTLTEEQLQKLESKNIKIVEKEIASINHDAGSMNSLTFKDGTTHAINALFARGGIVQHTDIATQLGCELNAGGMVPELIKVDDFGKTNVPGVYAAGDNAIQMRSLAAAIAAGNKAGAIINNEVIVEEF